MLDGLELGSTVLPQTLAPPARPRGLLTSRGAHYVAVVKKDHPGLYVTVRKRPWRAIPFTHRTGDHANHRDETAGSRPLLQPYPGARHAISTVM